MSDSYVAISEIAADGWMNERLRAAASQQAHIAEDTPSPWTQDPIEWVAEQRYIWASSPTWGEKWTYAKNTHDDDPNYLPGRDEAVITDADILATVQALAPVTPTP